MGYTNKGLKEYCESILKETTLYMWGGLMKPITKSYITAKKKQYPDRYSDERCDILNNFIGRGYGCDCVGLIKSYYFGGIGSPKYKADQDHNTNGMLNNAPKKGDIKSLPDVVGVGVYMPGHVGVYIGNGYVIECTLSEFGDGVVKTKLSDRKWDQWFYVPYIEYEENTECNHSCPHCCPKLDYQNYTVKPGDSYWRIASVLLGDGARYTDIIDLNGFDKNHVIHPGDVIKVPLK